MNGWLGNKILMQLSAMLYTNFHERELWGPALCPPCIGVYSLKPRYTFDKITTLSKRII